MLSMTKIELVLISDSDMYMFYDKGIRAEFLTLLKDTVKLTINI